MTMEILRSSWLWLFPLTYLVHLAEEAWAGERFYRWIARVAGRPMSPAAWIALNALFFGAMVLAVRGVRTSAAPVWVVPGLATVVAINALAHLVSSRVTRSYSPGLWSGLALWLPLGAGALWVSARSLPAMVWWQGLAAGIVTHGLVALLAVSATRLTPRP